MEKDEIRTKMSIIMEIEDETRMLNSEREFLVAARPCGVGIAGGFCPVPGCVAIPLQDSLATSHPAGSQHCLAHGNSDERLEFS